MTEIIDEGLLKVQLRENEAIRIYNVDTSIISNDNSIDFLQSDWPHYKIMIPLGRVFVWKHGVEYTVLNTRAVSANNGIKNYFYIPKKPHTNYMYKCKEEFNIRVRIACVVDIKSNMEESDKYKEFQKFAPFIDSINGNTTGMTGQYVLQLAQNNSIDHITQYGNARTMNEWNAWKVKAAKIKNMMHNSTVSTNLEYEVKVVLNNQKELPYFFNKIDSVDQDIIESNMATDLTFDLKSLHSIKCKYEDSNGVSAYNHPAEEQEIRMHLNNRVQSGWKAYGVSEVKWLPGIGYSENAKSEIRTKLDDFHQSIDNLVDEWNDKYQPILEEIRRQQVDIGKTNSGIVIKMLEIYLQHLAICTENGVVATPVGEFLRSMGAIPSLLHGNTQPLGSIPQPLDREAGISRVDTDRTAQ